MGAGHQREIRRLLELEAVEQLDRLADTVRELRRDGAHSELLATVARDAHLLESFTALMGFDAISAVAHRLGKLLRPVGAGRAPVEAPVLAPGIVRPPPLKRGTRREAGDAASVVVIDAAQDVDARRLLDAVSRLLGS